MPPGRLSASRRALPLVTLGCPARLGGWPPADTAARGALLRRGFALEYVTLAWNVAGIVVLAIAAVVGPVGCAGRVRPGQPD